MTSYFVCSVGETTEATVLCVCTDPPTFLCEEHRGKHLSCSLAKQGAFHSLTSAKVISKINSKDDYRKMKERLRILNERQSDLKDNLKDLESFKVRISNAFDQAIEALLRKKGMYEEKIGEWLRCADRDMQRAEEVTSMRCFDNDFQATSELETIILNSSCPIEKLFSCEVKIKEDMIAEVVDVSLKCEIPTYKQFEVHECSSGRAEMKLAMETITKNGVEIQELKAQEEKERRSKDQIAKDFESVNITKNQEIKNITLSREILTGKLQTSLKDAKEKAGNRFSRTWKCLSCLWDVPEEMSLSPHCNPASTSKPAAESGLSLNQKAQDFLSRWKCSCGMSNNQALDRCRYCMKAKKPPADLKTPEKKRNCSRCRRANEESSSECAFCQTLKGEELPSAEKSPAEWTCLRCLSANLRTLICPQCGSIKPTSPAKEACEKCRPAQSSSGVWSCSKCNTVNLVTSQLCKKCLKKRLADESPLEKKSWKCQFCGITDNFEDDDKCSQCSKPRNGQPQQEWVCRACNRANSVGSASCSRCGKLNESPDQVWACEVCRAKNKMGSPTCCQCRSKKSEEKGMAAQEKKNTEGTAVRQQMRFCKCGNSLVGDSKLCAECEARTATVNPGTWKCNSCQTDNRASADKCSYCLRTKLSGSASKQKRCSSCSNAVYGVESTCPICKKKGEAVKKCIFCRASVVTGSLCYKCQRS